MRTTAWRWPLIGVVLACCAACGSSQPSAAVRTQNYLRAVRPLYPKGSSERDIISLGQRVCHIAKYGLPESLIEKSLKPLSTHGAKVEIRAATTNLCPQYASRFGQ